MSLWERDIEHRLAVFEVERPRLLVRLVSAREASGKPATAHLAHRTARVALNEAVKRGHITDNPAKVARPPRVEEEEIVPFTVEEARRVLDAAANIRNGARFIVALTLGLRRGEALGLRWSDIDICWQHGCEQASTCRARSAVECQSRDLTQATLTVRRAVQQHVWKHGCTAADPCGNRYGAHCPKRHGGGVVPSDVKSRAGRRVVGIPLPLVNALERQREQQANERAHAGQLWHDEGWVFTNRIGNPVHPTVDYDAWKSLLKRAGVRNARLHDARHTAATMLLVLKVPLKAVMEIMGWSEASMAARYIHVPDDLVSAIAKQVGELMWSAGTDDSDYGAGDYPGEA